MKGCSSLANRTMWATCAVMLWWLVQKVFDPFPIAQLFLTWFHRSSHWEVETDSSTSESGLVVTVVCSGECGRSDGGSYLNLDFKQPLVLLFHPGNPNLCPENSSGLLEGRGKNMQSSPSHPTPSSCQLPFHLQADYTFTRVWERQAAFISVWPRSAEALIWPICSLAKINLYYVSLRFSVICYIALLLS